MSFRELRNFSEILRAIGYPRIVSIENFKQPNFKLVAEILAWFLKRFDPDYDIPLQIDTEQDRIIFIKSICLFMIQKAKIKVNPKKLYQADGYAVQEMLKISNFLYKTVRLNDLDDDEDEMNIKLSEMTNNLHTKLDQLKFSRQMASEIIDSGAALFDLLSKEVDLKEQRTVALSRPMEINDIEKNLTLSIASVEDEVRQILNALDNIANDEAALDAKIEKRKLELERQQKRLAQLQSVRPAYMDEYEKLQNELQHFYSSYVLKYRNLAYLEHLQENYDKIEMDRNAEAEARLRKMAEKMREDEQARLASLEPGGTEEKENNEKHARFMADRNPKVYGNITGAGLSEEEDEGDSLLNSSDDEQNIDRGVENYKRATNENFRGRSTSGAPTGAAPAYFETENGAATSSRVISRHNDEFSEFSDLDQETTNQQATLKRSRRLNSEDDF